MNLSPPNLPMWRSLAERVDSEGLRELLTREFPSAPSSLLGNTSRREFLQMMTATLALAGTAGCVRQPNETIVPAIETPLHPVGKPQFYATTMPAAGGGIGILVKSQDGRPIKIDGNDLHPASLGGTDIFAQAALMGLYDPDRSQVVRRNGAINTWEELLDELKVLLIEQRAAQGRGLRVLSGRVLSPTVRWQRERLHSILPEARWHEYEPIDDASIRAGAEMAFGVAVSPVYRFDQADVILAIDADFLGTGSPSPRYARDFASRRRFASDDESSAMSRLYVIESTPTLTGAAADHRLAMTPRDVVHFVAALASRLGVELEGADSLQLPQVSTQWWDGLLADLNDESRRPLLLAGPSQPPAVHALVHLINDHLGAVDRTVSYVENESADDSETLRTLVEDINAGEVNALIILDSNPVYSTPADLEFGQALSKVSFSLHLGLELDETAAACTWHVPMAHFLESWGDVRAYDGSPSLVQPLIAPLFSGRTSIELLNVLLEEPNQSAYDTLRDYWRNRHGEEDFEDFWRESLHDGIIKDASLPVATATLREGALNDISTALSPHFSANERELTALFRPHPTIGDGRFANNGWLQELPQLFTKLTWSNAALLSPRDGEQYGLGDGDVVELSANSRQINIPVAIVPGQADGVITLHIGMGRTHSGRVGTNVGVDVGPLRVSNSMWSTPVSLKPTGEHVQLPSTQHHFLMDGRDLVRAGTQEEYLAHPGHPLFMQQGHGHAAPADSLYGEQPPLEPGQYQWGMSIDLSTCTGCSACVVACNAENNIPVVGAEEVTRGREMHWLRIDTYFEGEPDNPRTYHQPVLCMHCEHAPCEVVCPVAATTHSNEGLNEMTYNRCIGTRYCSNNCPYKVRRFNFFDYQQQAREEPVVQLQQNPEVSVRSRGVMEKCTYCVQRINNARINAEMEDRDIADGEVVTACQAACPTQAIVFGNIADPDSAVSRQKARNLSYGLLEELNTRPRTTYLAAIRNPHSELHGGNE